jgi:hypothetical protein
MQRSRRHANEIQGSERHSKRVQPGTLAWRQLRNDSQRSGEKGLTIEASCAALISFDQVTLVQKLVEAVPVIKAETFLASTCSAGHGCCLQCSESEHDPAAPVFSRR